VKFRLESNVAAVRFASTLVEGAFDVVIFLTGVGARRHARGGGTRTSAAAGDRGAVTDPRCRARGPKPLAVMREWQVPVWIVAPEPNTWRELVAAFRRPRG
jgi:uroporphyrinogen-III synthase